MARAASQNHAPPALDIKLHQNPNAFFFPASTISGHVIYMNHHGNADYDLRLIFRGSNIVATHGASDQATLFEYTFNLHTARKGRSHKLANSQVDVAPMTFPFKHRFPAATDNRSFSLACDTFPMQAFNDNVHDLPPSFSSHSCNFQCSVSYTLQAELYYDSCLLSEHTLPIMFLPYARVSPAKSFSDFGVQPPQKHSQLSRKDSVIDDSLTTAFNVSMQLPAEVSPGLPFALEVHLQLPYLPEFDDEIPEVQISGLKLLATTGCRVMNSKKDVHRKNKAILLQPLQSLSTPTVHPESRTVCYFFYATLSSYYAPSFRSFLVSNMYVVEGPLRVIVDGRVVDVGLGDDELTVLSPITQQAGLRKVSAVRNVVARASACHARV